VIAPSRLGKILAEKPSVVDDRILVVRILRSRIQNSEDRRHGLSRRIALRTVVGRRIPADRSSEAVLLRDVQVRADRLPDELRRLVSRSSMIREVMLSASGMGLIWKNDSRQHAVSVGRNADSVLRPERINSFLPASAIPR
jgi:hypothetical protein